MNDKELLLFTHGELPLVPGLRAAYHLRHCSACRQRQARLISASSAFAGVIRGHGLPEWPGVKGRVLPLSLGRTLLARPFALAVVILLCFSASAVFAYAASSGYLSLPSLAPPAAPCHAVIATPTPHRCIKGVSPAKSAVEPVKNNSTCEKP